ncbi:MAG: TonB-dependent receptor [Cloacibacillus evryensis]
MKGEQKNLPELLKQVPGLHVVESKGRGAYTVASVRGSTAAEVSVFVDGILMNLGSEAAVDLSTIPVDNVERIEVYRGYVPARFAGASMGGVINIITKKPTKQGVSLSLGAGSYGLFKTNLSYTAPLGKGKFLFGANFESNDGNFKYINDNNSPYTPGDDYEAERQNNGYKNTDVLAKWNDDNWQLRWVEAQR